jgi:hypothetical protein
MAGREYILSWKTATILKIKIDKTNPVVQTRLGSFKRHKYQTKD